MAGKTVRVAGYSPITPETIMALTERVPNRTLVMLPGYAFGTQNLDQIKGPAGEALRNEWPEGFTTYVAYPKEGSSIPVWVYDLAVIEADILARWQFVEEDWFKRELIQVEIEGEMVDVYIDLAGDKQIFTPLPLTFGLSNLPPSLVNMTKFIAGAKDFIVE